MNTAISMGNFSFAIDGKDILRDVSLEIASGEFLAVIGPNGAGKTTLLKCLMRILAGGHGQVRIQGTPIEGLSQRELARKIGYVPQPGGYPLPYTVSQFVMMGRFPHMGPFAAARKTDHDVVRAALEMTGTLQFARRSCATLSGGERQKVMIAAALTQEAEILLLDEPTSFLDPHHRVDIHERLHRINREWGVTIVMVTHDLNAASLLADKAVALKEGAVIFCGATKEALQTNLLEKVYDTPFVALPHPGHAGPLVLEKERI